MMALADNLGRQHAHEAVHHAATTTGHTFTDVIAHDPAITSRLTPSQLNAFLDPASHTGQSARIAQVTTSETEAAKGEAEHPTGNTVVPEDELMLDLTNDSHPPCVRRRHSPRA